MCNEVEGEKSTENPPVPSERQQFVLAGAHDDDGGRGVGDAVALLQQPAAEQPLAAGLEEQPQLPLETECPRSVVDSYVGLPNEVTFPPIQGRTSGAAPPPAPRPPGAAAAASSRASRGRRSPSRRSPSRTSSSGGASPASSGAASPSPTRGSSASRGRAATPPPPPSPPTSPCTASAEPSPA